MHQATRGEKDAFIVRPDREGPFPAVVVAHDVHGVDEPIKDVCRRLAQAGYAAVAPELYDTAQRVPEGSAPLANATNDAVMKTFKSALAQARRLPDVMPWRVGVIGFGVGGFLAFLAACHTDAATAVSFYGDGVVRAREGRGFSPALPLVKRTAPPILCFFGAEDERISAADVGEVRERLAARTKMHELVVYSGAGHGFFLEGTKAYRPDAARDAWQRMIAWLAKTLNAEAPPVAEGDAGGHQMLVSGAAMRVIRSR